MNRVKVISRTEIDPKKRAAFKDFDQLESKIASPKRGWKHWRYYSVLAAVSAVSVLLIYLTKFADNHSSPSSGKVIEAEAPHPPSHEVISIPKRQQQNPSSEPILSEKFSSTDDKQQETTLRTESSRKIPSMEEEVPSMEETSSHVERVDEVMPVTDPATYQYVKAKPNMSIQAFYKLLGDSLHHKYHAEGKVGIRFKVQKDGQLSQFTIVSSLDAKADSLVIGLFEQLPPWQPATVNDSPVVSYAEVPFVFQDPD
ncbi:MAG: hypothetical protein KI790_07025 [Cyclobacteriaceae bacterium]|nr:hypothetical protein [Cyclobacteriaceae bacterium HetDA_MAG_MS6]